jgi:putative sterol carrier protein
MTMTSDDLLDLVAGRLPMASAWATGRVRIDASVLDLLRLRSVF